MNKEVIIGIIIAIIIIFMVGALILIPKQEKSCETLMEEQDYIIRHVDKAIEKSNENICEEICSQEGIDICYQIVARRIQNPDICENIVNNLHHGQCIFSFENRTAELCQSIRNITAAGYCLRIIANVEGNETICELILDETEKQFCFDNVKEGPVEIKGDGSAEEIKFNCSILFSQCNAEWLNENRNEIRSEISEYCSDECRKISRRSGRYATNVDSAEITCGCS